MRGRSRSQLPFGAIAGSLLQFDPGQYATFSCTEIRSDPKDRKAVSHEMIDLPAGPPPEIRDCLGALEDVLGQVVGGVRSIDVHV